MIDRLNAALEGRYRILEQIGEGGMATVYLADDLKHERKVALKVLKPELAAVVGAERFLAEIKTTANLQHPHILPLYDSGQAGSFLFFVMPYVADENLEERLDREKQLPVEEALSIARAVAAGMDYAHRQGVVHRDIKPANILLQDGQPVVADFGIALAVQEAGGGRLTETGLSVGTPYYMSPEQATADRDPGPRSDVYSLGCVLYQMLTGEPPFPGSTAQAVLGKILTSSPPRASELRKSVPPWVDEVILHALEKLPADRFGSAAEFAAALEGGGAGSATRHTAGVGRTATGKGGAGPGAGPDNRLKTLIPWAIAAAATLTAIALGVSNRTPDDPAPVRRYSMELPGHTLASSAVGRRVDISADGSRIVYGALSEGGRWQLWLRHRDQLQARGIPGTETATTPTFSPDGTKVAYTTQNGTFAVVGLNGEPPLQIDAPGNQTLGLDWGEDDRLYYAGPDGIYRIPSRGGEAERVTTADTAGGEFLHAFPRALPGGKGLLYTAVSGVGINPDASNVAVVDLETGETRTLMRGMGAGYAASGHVLSLTPPGTILAAPFDLGTLRTTNEPAAVLQGVATTVNGVDLTLSDEGTLVYLGTPDDNAAAAQLKRVNREGRETTMDSEWQGEVTALAVSPTGDRLAVSLTSMEGGNLWVSELPGGSPEKRTFQGTTNDRPEWSPDGEDLVFFSDRQGGFDLWQVRADGSSPARLLLDDPRDVVAARFSPDGNWLAYRTNALQAPGADILAVGRSAEGTLEGDAIPLMTAPGVGERAPTFSPDGRWIAYVSDESGQDEIYVRPFPGVEAAVYQISVEGATEPLWSRGGGEIFYRRTGTGDLVSVAVRTEPSFAPGERRVLFPAAAYASDYHHRLYDVLPGDTAFVFVPQAVTGGRHLVVVENFFRELRERAGEGR